MTQRDTVLKLLAEAKDHGVSSHELIYTHGITRGAAVVWDLRQEGWNIETIDEGMTDDGRQKLARYVLRRQDGEPLMAPERRPPPEPEPFVEPVDVSIAMDEWAKLGVKLKAAKAEEDAKRLAKNRSVPWR